MIAQIDREYLRHGVARTVRRIASYGLYEGRPFTQQKAVLSTLWCSPG